MIKENIFETAVNVKNDRFNIDKKVLDLDQKEDDHI